MQPDHVQALERAIHDLKVRIEELTRKFEQSQKIPISVALIISASLLFYFTRIQERTWLTILLLAVFPWYGEPIRWLASKFWPDRESRAANTLKLLLFGGLAVYGLV